MSRLMYCLSRQQRAHCCRHSSLLSASCLQRFDTRQQATRSAGSRNDRTSSSPSDGNNPRMSILCSLNSAAAAWPQLWVSISTTRYLALPVHQTLQGIDSLVARYERTLTSTATTLRLLRLLFWWWDTNSKHGWQTRGNVSEKAKNACRVRGHAVVELATTCDSATRTPTRCSTCKLNRSKKQNGRHEHPSRFREVSLSRSSIEGGPPPSLCGAQQSDHVSQHHQSFCWCVNILSTPAFILSMLIGSARP